MKLQEQQISLAIQKLTELEAFEKSPAYQWLMLPLLKELDSLKSSYDCKTLQEMATLKGRRSGLAFVPDTIEQVRREGEIARQIEAEREKVKQQIDYEINNPEFLDL